MRQDELFSQDEHVNEHLWQTFEESQKEFGGIDL